MNLTERFSKAFELAYQLHSKQFRKGTDIPYISHLMAVSAAVLEWGGDEDTAIAALLHDAVEDQGGLLTAERIGSMFGDRVVAIVLGCSDSTAGPNEGREPWDVRKNRYVAHLTTSAPEVALVAACDKLHNLNALIRDLDRDGPATLSRFSATPVQSAWYFAAVADAVQGRAPATLVQALSERASTFAAKALA